MSINTVGSYSNITALRRPVAAPATAAVPAAPVANTAAGGAIAAAAPTGGGVLGGLSLGRLASWAGGAFGGFKLWSMVARTGPQGWVLGGVLAGGAFLGNKVYNMVTGQSSPTGGSGSTMKMAAGAGGAFGAWKLLGSSMRGWPLAGVVAGGALGGVWLYKKLTGK